MWCCTRLGSAPGGRELASRNCRKIRVGTHSDRGRVELVRADGAGDDLAHCLGAPLAVARLNIYQFVFEVALNLYEVFRPLIAQGQAADVVDADNIHTNRDERTGLVHGCDCRVYVDDHTLSCRAHLKRVQSAYKRRC